MSEGYAKLEVVRKSGDETCLINGAPSKMRLLDFWRWASSDLANNTTRGIFAEYLVACALGLNDGIRIEWDAFDLLTPLGVRIEVKSSAYLQSWFHRKLSGITFDIRPTRSWDSATNNLSDERKRQSDLYIFCLLHHQDKATLDPLNLDQWTFYVLRAAVLDEKYPLQKTIGLASLLKLNPLQVRYEEIVGCVKNLTSHT